MLEPSAEVVNLIKTLDSSRERYILELRLGIDSDRPHTLQEIADKLEITRERVRQIQHRALSKLRSTELNSLLLSQELSSSNVGTGLFKKKPRQNSNALLHKKAMESPNTSEEFIVVTFKEAVKGKDPEDQTVFLSNRHKVRAEWARQDGTETLFIIDGEIVARWPTRLIDLITWPNGDVVPSSPKEFANRMSEIKQKYPKAWSKWSWEEEQSLITKFKGGKSVKEISEILGRAPGGIFSRLRRIELIPADSDFREDLVINNAVQPTRAKPTFVGSVYQLIEDLYAIKITHSPILKLDKKFSENGWFMPTDQFFRCPDCSKLRIVVLRRHWKNMGRVFHRWAVICLECDRVGESRDFDNQLVEEIHEAYELLPAIEENCPDCRQT